MQIPLLSNSHEFPDPRSAGDDGLVAIGGDLRPERLLQAYRAGIFPWYSQGQPILWFSPNPRMTLDPSRFRCHDSMRRVIRSGKFTLGIDTNFGAVIRSCASVPRREQSDTWITDEMIAAYIEMHRLGYGHSFETYENGVLVGGLYGLSMGKAFFGESMFHTSADASKFALSQLVSFCLHRDFRFIDVQIPSDHMRRMGAEEIHRDRFLEELAIALEADSIIGHWETTDGA